MLYSGVVLLLALILPGYERSTERKYAVPDSGWMSSAVSSGWRAGRIPTKSCRNPICRSASPLAFQATATHIFNLRADFGKMQVISVLQAGVVGYPATSEAP